MGLEVQQESWRTGSTASHDNWMVTNSWGNLFSTCLVIAKNTKCDLCTLGKSRWFKLTVCQPSFFSNSMFCFLLFILQISASRRISLLQNRLEILYEYESLLLSHGFLLLGANFTLSYPFYRVLDASLTASASPDCSLKMAYILSQVKVVFMIVQPSVLIFLF